LLAWQAIGACRLLVLLLLFAAVLFIVVVAIIVAAVLRFVLSCGPRRRLAARPTRGRSAPPPRRWLPF